MALLRKLLALLAGRSDLVLALMLIAVIFMMIIPLPPAIMDVLQAINLGISAILLMVAVYIRSPLSFVSFPSLLLLTTLFRLSLGVASTRLILLEANAGDIILTFGNFVVAGNLVVGAVIFLIITIVQFVVITKGSERVAEVAARFSLDAMPGKQMSIDGDMRAGTIDMAEARRRRSGVEKESQLYGAMDGAMKFVKGDAIASLIAIAVNLIGGLAIGTMQRGMPVGEALETYAILTIGDGMVGQIPALFTSITAGLIVTRVTDESAGDSNLGSEIGSEVTAQPRALMVGAVVLVLFAGVPGFPAVVFLGLAAAAGGSGYMLHRGRTRPAPAQGGFSALTMPASASARENESKQASADVDDFSLTVPLMVDVAPDIETAMQAETLNAELARVRHALYFDLGVPFPGILLRINPALKDGSYSILIHEVPCGEGRVRPGRLLARDSAENLGIAGVPFEDDKPFLPLIETRWVDAARVDTLRAAGVAYMEPPQILSYHIAHVLRRYADEFLGLQETRFLLTRMEDRFPELVKEVQRIVPLQRIAEILQRLVSEGVSVRNMRAILSALIEWGQKEKDTVLLTEYVRGALKRQICYRHSSGLNIIPAYVVTPELEDTLRNAIRQTSSGSYLALDPQITRQIVEKVRRAMGDVARQTSKPVLLTSMDVRRYLRRIVEGECRDLPVLSYQELTPEITVQPLARVSL
ncbi:type III secretion system export apparatus subunit SctV [Belnapia sp. T18]|uniref:Type III secretion system export apparatus subunit SctV n=1 Tax=Belnapia arida TaxID=2804533 RepID=A0ABS1U5U9_9PROT|nr:type III secretion system export apparatus subunit SctV [Belnapia arida]MBL6080023.1 type III secretion system export apparatus subunit SctV [Belnapia arida]